MEGDGAEAGTGNGAFSAQPLLVHSLHIPRPRNNVVPKIDNRVRTALRYTDCSARRVRTAQTELLVLTRLKPGKSCPVK